MPGDMLTPQPEFVLVHPQMGENIGAAARAMLNFGLSRMVLVSPRDGWPNPRAKALAAGAGRVLDAARLVESTAQAIADCHYVYATTARLRGLTKPVLAPDAAMADARARIGQGQRVAVLFGPERAGLENADILAANALIRVPVNPDFPSLNLAQCVLLCAYEWGQAGGDFPQPAITEDRSRPATAQEIDILARAWEEKLEAIGFFWPEHKAASMKASLRNIFSRLPLTDIDLRTFHGILKALTGDRPPRR